jgi:outer membrane receptor for ferrienterochelin and colicins
VFRMCVTMSTRSARAGWRRRASVVPAILVLVGALALATVAAAQTGSVTGAVTDSGTGRPLLDALVELVDSNGAVAARSYTRIDGHFRLVGIPAGNYSLAVTHVGYRPGRAPDLRVTEDVVSEVSLAMTPVVLQLDPVVVTAKRSSERASEAAASVSVVEANAIEEQPAVTPVHHVRDAPGVDLASTGMMQSLIVARGFNDIFSGSLLVLTDGRYDFVPSLRVNAPWLIPSPDEDIERIEVQLGPGAALYGPNAADGVLQLITKSPFDWQGTTFALGGVARGGNGTGGSGELVRGAIRHAGMIGDKVGYKVTGQYLSGDDWVEFDPLEVRRRDFGLERWSGEARVDVRLGDDTDGGISFGRTHAGRALELTGVGAVQVRGWNLDYVHARARHGRLFAQAFLNASDAGNTFLLRTGKSIIDHSRMFVGQLQHRADWGARQNFIYGLDFQRTEPRTMGTIMGRNEADDAINEIGGYLHSESRLSPKLDLITAARVDKHSRLEHAVFSPRGAIVYKPTESHTFRLTYNRAFNTPSTDQLFTDVVVGSLSPIPINVRLIGVPEGGLRFRHDCASGLCMYSPADPGTALPVDGTRVWGSLVSAVRTFRGVDLGGIPPPSAADVRSALRVLNVTKGTFHDVDAGQLRDAPPLRETVTNSVEAGYKGFITDRVRLAVDAYYEWRKDFVADVVETPNVFLEGGDIGQPGTMAAYLARFMPADSATMVALLIDSIPLGTVSPDSKLTGNSDVILTYRNFGTLHRWGSDVAVQAVLSDVLTIGATYSWTSRDFFPRAEVGGLTDIALNAPKNKGSLGLQVRSERTGLSGSLRARYVEGFPVVSGVYMGRVESYALADAGLTYRVPGLQGLMLSVDAQNLFNNQHREFVGAPVIGRFVIAQAQYTVP